MKNPYLNVFLCQDLADRMFLIKKANHKAIHRRFWTSRILGVNCLTHRICLGKLRMENHNYTRWISERMETEVGENHSFGLGLGTLGVRILTLLTISLTIVTMRGCSKKLFRHTYSHHRCLKSFPDQIPASLQISLFQAGNPSNTPRNLTWNFTYIIYHIVMLCHVMSCSYVWIAIKSLGKARNAMVARGMPKIYVATIAHRKIHPRRETKSPSTIALFGKWETNHQ
jgi:hypothetical protein